MDQSITTAIAAARTSSVDRLALSKECQQKVQRVCQTYQSYEDFNQKNNPDTQLMFGSDERQSIMGDYSTLATLDMALGVNTASRWLVTLLGNLNMFIGAKNMDDSQTEWLARLLAQEYKDVKYSVIQLFFYKFKCGSFGKFYGMVDPMVITCSLKDFVKKCEVKCQEYLNEEYAEHKKEEQQWQELQNRAKGHWFRCQKSLIEDCPDKEGKELFNRIDFFGFYENTRTLILSANDSDYGIIERRYFDFFKRAIIKSFPNIRVECRITDKED